MEISVIVPLYNRSDLTSHFIGQLAPYLNQQREIVFVDNSSEDNTLSLLYGIKKNYQKYFPIKVISLEKNYGFGAANNIGVKLSKSDRLLFISNDVEILGDVITPVLEILKKPRTAVGPRLLTYDTGWNTFTRFGTIGYLEGFCFALEKTIFNMIGGFDENIFLDYEDIDLSLRLHLAGIDLLQINLPVMHQLGQSFTTLNKSRLDFTLASLNYFKKKWACELIQKK